MSDWNSENFLVPQMMVGDNLEILTHLPQLGHCGVVASYCVGGGTKTSTTNLKHLANQEMYVFSPRVWFNIEN
jgi:hypothetical protein